MLQIQIKRETVVQTRLQVRFEKVLSSHLKNEFNKVSKLFVEAYNGNKSIDIVKPAHQKRLLKILTAVLGETAKTFSDRLIGKANYLGLEHKRQNDEFSLSIQAWLNANAKILSARLSANTAKTVTEVIKQGQISELHPREIAKNIHDKTGGKIGLNRANMIARTEVHGAAGYGELQAAINSGLDLVKVWGSSEDHRTRITHSLANHQKRELKDNFSIGGEAVRYPGDGKLSAKQRINCRCVVLYEPRSKQKPKEVQEEAIIYDYIGRDRFKYHAEKVVKLLNKHDLNGKISLNHAVLINWYTDLEGFQALNTALRTGKATKEQKIIRKHLNEALSHMPKYEGVSHRVIDLDTKLAMDTYPIGEIVPENAFVSTSKLVKTNFDGNVHFVILSRTGREIHKLSRFANEQEVLLMAGSKLRVIEHEIINEQLTIRLIQTEDDLNMKKSPYLTDEEQKLFEKAETNYDEAYKEWVAAGKPITEASKRFKTKMQSSA